MRVCTLWLVDAAVVVVTLLLLLLLLMLSTYQKLSRLEKAVGLRLKPTLFGQEMLLFKLLGTNSVNAGRTASAWVSVGS